MAAGYRQRKGVGRPLELRGVPAAPDVTHLSLNNQFRDMVLSPDGRKVAFTVHGEVFAASSRDGGSAVRVSHTAADEVELAWTRQQAVAYVSDRGGAYHIYVYDFTDNQETRVSDSPAGETQPLWSPDGKLLAYLRGGKELCAYDAASKQVRSLATAAFAKPPLGYGRPYSWSPDNRWVAYATRGERSFRNIYVVPAAGGQSRQISFLSNTNAGTPLWSPDGTFILFDTAQRTENNTIARIDLIEKTPHFREDRFRDLFKDQPGRGGRGEGAGGGRAGQNAERPPVKPVEIVFEGIRNRLSQLNTGIDARAQQISPDGRMLLLSTAGGRQPNLYTFSLDDMSAEPPVARQLTSTPGANPIRSFRPMAKRSSTWNRAASTSSAWRIARPSRWPSPPKWMWTSTRKRRRCSSRPGLT